MSRSAWDRRGSGDEFNDRPVGGEWPAPPVHGMKLNIRCSILFHLDVPGGMWQTVMISPMVAASLASSTLRPGSGSCWNRRHRRDPVVASG